VITKAGSIGEANMLEHNQPGGPQPKRRFTTLAASDHFERYFIRNLDGSRHLAYARGVARRLNSYLDRYRTALKRVARSSIPPWRVQRFGGRDHFIISPEAQDLWRSIRNADDYLLAKCSGLRMNPWLQLGLHVLDRWGSELRYYNIQGMLSLREEGAQKCFGRIVRFVRRVAKLKGFQKELTRAKLRAEATYDSCAEYVLKVFEADARLLVLRLELYFDKDAKEISDSETAERAIDKFVRWVRETKDPDGLCGYILVREDAVDRRVHCSVMILLDGNDHRNAYALTEVYGEYWVNECVGSPVLGSTKNCWERRREYENSCLGLMHYSDESMLMGMRDALKYMAKLEKEPNVYVKEGVGHNLRKGQPPLPAVSGKKRGAPRRQSDDLAAARRILLRKNWLSGAEAEAAAVART
jgi:hypothetical protein